MAGTGEISRITVIGAGVMGVSIGALGVSRGLRVTLIDNDPGQIESAASRVAQEIRLAKFMGAVARDAVPGELVTASSLADGLPADAVVEAVVEIADEKARVLKEASVATGACALLVTNTSSIPVDELAECLPHPEAVLGIHFMNPAYLIPAVEVVPGSRTSRETEARALSLLTALGRKGVIVGDGPGFVTSRISHRMINDAIKVVEEGRASVEDVDLLMQGCLGHATGPLRTADLIGLDNLADSLRILFERTSDDSFHPASLLLQKVAMGHHGRKSGRGFYIY